ncbi:hypothetical protein FACS189497_05950 [Betaproteobacteria bacterium]|nr:hypothetical protein FACS189497_05950 [Betaproteobacteria bacterium]
MGFSDRDQILNPALEYGDQATEHDGGDVAGLTIDNPYQLGHGDFNADGFQHPL